jgi:hypothetical protein
MRAVEGGGGEKYPQNLRNMHKTSLSCNNKRKEHLFSITRTEGKYA